MRLQIAIVIMIEWSTNKGDRERLCFGTKKGRAENADPPKAMPLLDIGSRFSGLKSWF